MELDEVKKEVEKSLLFVSKAEEDRLKLFFTFLLSLTEKEKEAVKQALVKNFGLKE